MTERKIDKNHTLYAIFLLLQEDKTIQIGALGSFHFPKGKYVYIGSAKKNIESRVNRHDKMDKPKRWHLDYFRPYCEITAIYTYHFPKGECALAASFLENGTRFPPQFGSSDCRCGGHLIKINN